MHPQKIKIRWQSNPDMSGQMEVHSPQDSAPPGKEHYIYIASLRNAPGQGAQIMRAEAYLRYAAVSLPRRKPGKDAAERSPDKSGFTKPSAFGLTFYQCIANILLKYIVESSMMIEKALKNIAERILALDEASLSGLWEKYKARLENFDTTEEWERSAIIFFIINSVKVKNNIFNKEIMNRQNKASQSKKTSQDTPPYLKRIK